MATRESLHDLMRKGRVRDAAVQRRHLKTLLGALREHFDMDVAFVSGFDDNERRIHEMDIAPRAAQMNILKGQANPLQETYCYRVVSGKTPELLRDAREEPSVADLTATFDLPIGTHVSVPITLPDGTICGTLCCFSRSVDPSFSERDLELLRILADFVARNYHDAHHNHDTTERSCEELAETFREGRFSIALQPIKDLATMALIGSEALTRFTSHPERTANNWFAQAAACGGLEVAELAIVRQAIPLLQNLPPTAYLSMNVSPRTLSSAALREMIAAVFGERLVFELTEHDAVSNYDQVCESLNLLRAHGARLAIDDFGAGYSNFRHVLGLSPDFIKLDISIVRGIESDRAKKALTAALVTFCRDLNVGLIAEGIETGAEKATLRQLGVRSGQGYLLGKPEIARAARPVHH